MITPEIECEYRLCKSEIVPTIWFWILIARFLVSWFRIIDIVYFNFGGVIMGGFIDCPAPCFYFFPGVA